ncbi:hypothetical protein PspLS_11567 [Pyricularia sp. CBS 133598]|nr:hypothetical protein PspLS_11567 [Pyricularia sp. CBS 133598]
MSGVKKSTGSRDLTPSRVESCTGSPLSLNRKPELAVTVDPTSDQSQPNLADRGLSFWAVFVSLSFMAFMSSMEGGMMSTALPSISRAVNAEGDYVWFVNAYYLTSQLADIWGRRWPVMTSIMILAVGSAICGAADNAGTLIVGRAIQGLGAAGINTLMGIILRDLFSLQNGERLESVGFLFLSTLIGAVLGPFLGGIIVDEASWRWIFFLNLPICGLCFSLLFFSLKPTKHHSNDELTPLTPLQKLKKIDYDVGIILLCASVTSLAYALTYGGNARYAWSHPVIITTLVLGFAGHGLFIVFEASPWCLSRNPVLPGTLFQNRKSIAAPVLEVVMTFVYCGVLYLLPLYFQSTLSVSPLISGVLLLPFALSFCISPAFGARMVNSGSFRLVHVVSFALMTITMGVFTLLDHSTPVAATAILAMMAGFAVGLPDASLLTLVQEGSTSAFAFIRSISTVFAFTIQAAIFNSRFDQLLSASTLESSVKQNLQLGKAYQASPSIVNTFPAGTRDQIIGVYELSLKLVWQVLIGVAAIGVVASLLEKALKCQAEETVEEFGLEDSEGTPSDKSVV